MRAGGQNGQDSKLIVGHGEMEFLRRMFTKTGCIYGYLNRSIPNIVATDY